MPISMLAMRPAHSLLQVPAIGDATHKTDRFYYTLYETDREEQEIGLYTRILVFVNLKKM